MENLSYHGIALLIGFGMGITYSALALKEKLQKGVSMRNLARINFQAVRMFAKLQQNDAANNKVITGQLTQVFSDEGGKPLYQVTITDIQGDESEKTTEPH